MEIFGGIEAGGTKFLCGVGTNPEDVEVTSSGMGPGDPLPWSRSCHLGLHAVPKTDRHWRWCHAARFPLPNDSQGTQTRAK